MDNNRINYSIIIPHYNTPKLLERCINSIPQRDDIEIIVVDDNSPLDSGFWRELIDRCSNELKLFRQNKNQGAGVSRNIGISNAKGEWLLFCDADDFFLDGFLNYLDNYLITSADIVFFNIKSVYSDTLNPAYRHIKVNDLIDSALSQDVISIKKLKYSFLEPFAKLYNHGFVKKNKIQFQDVFYSNDTLFTLTAALKAQVIKIDKHQIYCVTVSKGSLTNTISMDSLYTRIKVAIQANNLLKENKEKEFQIPVIQFIVMARYFGFKTIINVICILLKNKQNIFKGFSDQLKKLIKIINPEYRKHSNLSKLSKTRKHTKI